MKFARRFAVAAILLAALFFAISGGREIWGIASLLAVLLAAREWGRLAGLGGGANLFFVLLTLGFLIICATLFLENNGDAGANFLGGLCVFWAIFAPCCLIRRWLPPRAILCAIGILSLGGAWLSSILLYDAAPIFLAGALGIAWLADAAAYVFGKTLGKTPMSPLLSPKKTWEGFGGAILAGHACAIIFRLLEFADDSPLMAYAIFCVCAVMLGTVGDLWESLMKRRAGVKDSGGLLPGHGGMLDRVDSVLPVLPFAGLLLP